VEWTNAEELRTLFADGSTGHHCRERSDEAIRIKEKWLALGGGNNILFTADYEGTLIKSANREIVVINESSETLNVRAGAGVDWDDFVDWCIARGAWGVENLSGIPGTVGAAPIQNIGAYGAEVKDVIRSVECFDTTTGKLVKIAAGHCGFGYRDSVFKSELRGRVIVTAVDFELSNEPRPNLHYAALAEKVSGRTTGGQITLETISRAVKEIRNSKLPDPRKTGNAGSFFKNPVVTTTHAKKLAEEHSGMPVYPAPQPGMSKLSAGWLIEQSGWKGRTEGQVGIHSGQALIVVNLGGATGKEIMAFAKKVQDDVNKKFGVQLIPEVNIIC
jgi:UDP-N-acetylmuramate dehydrogenase